MNVLIYDGPGIANLQKPLIKAIKKCLGNCYDVIPVDHNTLNTQPWQESTKLLIMPGGRDLPFLESLEKPGGLKKIDQWVREMNGKYFGICAGSYFACSRIGMCYHQC
jgi:biotin--protein ligase